MDGACNRLPTDVAPCTAALQRTLAGLRTKPAGMGRPKGRCRWGGSGAAVAAAAVAVEANKALWLGLRRARKIVSGEQQDAEELFIELCDTALAELDALAAAEDAARRAARPGGLCGLFVPSRGVADHAGAAATATTGGDSGQARRGLERLQGRVASGHWCTRCGWRSNVQVRALASPAASYEVSAI